MSSIPPPPLPSSQVNHPRAVAALVCGIVGFFFFGVILGTVAIIMGYRARNEIRANPLQFKGDGLARAGLILGVVDVALNLVLAFGALGAS